MRHITCDWMIRMIGFLSVQALGLKRDDTFSVTMLGHCIEMYIGDTDAYIGRTQLIIWGCVLFDYCFKSLE